MPRKAEGREIGGPASLTFEPRPQQVAARVLEVTAARCHERASAAGLDRSSCRC
jgi:hypothetical protein